MSAALLFALLALATFRATRLLIMDDITERLRYWLRYGPLYLARHKRLRELLECPWCLSAYVGAAIVALTTLVVSVPVPVLMWAGCCAVTGLLSTLDGFLGRGAS